MTPGSYRAADADRDQVAEVLNSAYAEGRITLEEHHERTQAALEARTFDDLTALTTDLVPTQALPLHPSAPDQRLVVPEGAVTDSDRMSTVMSTIRREGRWRVRTHSVANNVMGDIKLDLTQATFDAPVVEVTGTQLMGNMVIRVPEGVTVRNEVTDVLADTSISDIGEPDPSMPTLVLKGTNIMGDIKVRGPKKRLRWRKARN
ncbi:MAG: DUF1707 domain-containing protein [Microlunatus sp.]|nr:DUF1707 domain-containing protein [Microlunatus sp.]MDN5770627.1 DUF1707 domain-containing protein [Microlunatus sp.]